MVFFWIFIHPWEEGTEGGRGLRVEEDLQWLKLRISSMALSECRSIVFVLHAPWASQPVPALLSYTANSEEKFPKPSPCRPVLVFLLLAGCSS